MAEEKKKLLNINIVDAVKLIRKDKKKMAIYMIVAAIVGLVIAFTTPKKYKSSVMLAPEESGQGFSGSISSLASMVGMNMKLGQTGDAIYPEIYPDIVSSTDFILKLFPMQVTTKDGKVKCDYYSYLTKYQQPALIEYPVIFVHSLIDKKDNAGMPKSDSSKNGGLISLTKKQEEVVKGVSGQIDCSVDKKTNVITITVEDQDPLVAATIADSVKSELQKAVTDYRTKKARVDLEYMEKLFNQAKADYDKARQRYAGAADANMDVTLESVKSSQDDLENEMQLKYNIYQTIVEQLQLAKSKVQERTPAFTVVQSATVPVKHSSTPKIVTLIVWLILGFLLRSVILFWKNREMFVNA